jgi:fructose-1,6-bisphosphatase/inositol monophosphatase family enzyme
MVPSSEVSIALAHDVDIDRVSGLLREVAADEVMPRFGRLEARDVERKPNLGDPEDVVSAVDRAVEARLSSALTALLPGSGVVGEESTDATPATRDLLRGPGWVWVIDPLDGTRNFVAGDERFGIMVALVRAGRTCAGWIYLPARAQLYVAEDGAGAYAGGVRMAVAGRAPSARRGALFTSFMPDALRMYVELACEGRFARQACSRCAAVDYPSVADGAIDFLVYYRLHPWDHAAPALFLSEAGGVVVHPDGRPYGPLDADETTIVAASADLAADVSGWLRG